MADDMSFCNDATEIGNVLFYAEGIEEKDIKTALIGVSHIVGDLQKKYKKQSMEIDRLKKRIHELKRGI